MDSMFPCCFLPNEKVIELYYLFLINFFKFMSGSL